MMSASPTEIHMNKNASNYGMWTTSRYPAWNPRWSKILSILLTKNLKRRHHSLSHRVKFMGTL